MIFGRIGYRTWNTPVPKAETLSPGHRGPIHSATLNSVINSSNELESLNSSNCANATNLQIKLNQSESFNYAAKSKEGNYSLLIGAILGNLKGEFHTIDSTGNRAYESRYHQKTVLYRQLVSGRSSKLSSGGPDHIRCLISLNFKICFY
ncbi:hypothetical protein AVEN_143244-1 [Araneus ventricosus]|uniref:Uncharacterized protein n=1 Tax=Araneus ventricosus TaxID=182803 RepID=A0A4Y2ADX9_ARAVE|nr:hypothetical protein AVEN_143244-1 [Araneus ventricosus]